MYEGIGNVIALSIDIIDSSKIKGTKKIEKFKHFYLAAYELMSDANKDDSQLDWSYIKYIGDGLLLVYFMDDYDNEKFYKLTTDTARYFIEIMNKHDIKLGFGASFGSAHGVQIVHYPIKIIAKKQYDRQIGFERKDPITSGDIFGTCIDYATKMADKAKRGNDVDLMIYFDEKHYTNPKEFFDKKEKNKNDLNIKIMEKEEI